MGRERFPVRVNQRDQGEKPRKFTLEIEVDLERMVKALEPFGVKVTIRPPNEPVKEAPRPEPLPPQQRPSQPPGFPKALTLLRLPELAAKLGISRTMIYQRMSEGAFPKPIRLGYRTVAWDEEEIDRWIQERRNARKSD